MARSLRSPGWPALRLRLGGWMLLAGLLLTAFNGVRADWDFSQILQTVEQRYGPPGPARGRIEAWSQMLQSARGVPEPEQLNAVNRFFNQQLNFQDDTRIWQQTDYWATPVEALIKGTADCEDYAQAKYFSLRRLGIPSEKLRITYVKALSQNQAHRVLTFYSPHDRPAGTGQPDRRYPPRVPTQRPATGVRLQCRRLRHRGRLTAMARSDV